MSREIYRSFADAGDIEGYRRIVDNLPERPLGVTSAECDPRSTGWIIDSESPSEALFRWSRLQASQEFPLARRRFRLFAYRVLDAWEASAGMAPGSPSSDVESEVLAEARGDGGVPEDVLQQPSVRDRIASFSAEWALRRDRAMRAMLEAAATACRSTSPSPAVVFYVAADGQAWAFHPGEDARIDEILANHAAQFRRRRAELDGLFR